jgi:ATP-dependent helicase/nuclease subunit B
VPDRPGARPRVFTIPPSAPFLPTLARAMLAGDLPTPGGRKPDPLSLPQATIYLPTRRAVRALREAFLEVSGGKAVLLPSIRTLGDPDEDAAIIFGSEADAEAGLAGASSAPAIGALDRRLALMRLVLAWGDRLRHEAETARAEFLPPASTPAQASYLAADLANLMDFIESEEVDLDRLQEIVPEAHAVHWQLTVDFLKIVTEHWPAYLADNGLVSPASRRSLLMNFEAERLLATPPKGPVIAAGSTGTVPATARLLKVIASLPNGAVVLPGLDYFLDDESWASLARHPEHPQTGMAELLGKLGLVRAEVGFVPGSEPSLSQAARLQLVSEVLRPAGHTDRWQAFLQTQASRRQGTLFGPASALTGIHRLEAPTAHDEAEAIALILRGVIETPDQTAALITPDRTLARRVAARLKAYDLAIDDSAGTPVARTVPGAFLDLMLSAVASDFAAPDLMALLKHPLALLGRPPVAIRSASRALERVAFRDTYVGQGLGGIAEALRAALGKRRRRAPPPEELREAERLVADLGRALAPLASLYADEASHPAAVLAEAHSAAAEALARDSAGSSSGLWQGDAGEALSVLFAELIAAKPTPELNAKDYAPFYRSLVAGRVARPRAPAHPRLSIWGPLEARLQQPDVVILGSLNEGVWPRPQEASPWLSRPMAEELKLPPPERRIGLSAHDFAQALSAPTVYLTRAIKVDGVPTVPSRWLQRFAALVEAAGLDKTSGRAEPFVAWARHRDDSATFEPAPRPMPCPPVAARPRRLSVSRIERMLANPYDIYARDILKLQPLGDLGAEPDARLRGTIVHAALHEFTAKYPDRLPANLADELIAIADRQFAELGGSARVAAFWRPSFERFARWFEATEGARRAGILTIAPEVSGSLKLDIADGFELTARADRIDIADDGTVAIYDYKSGQAPSQSHVDDLYAPQLPLEGAIAVAGGFGDLGPRVVGKLAYVKASGQGEGGEERAAGSLAAGDLATLSLAALRGLIARFDRADTPYEAKRRSAFAFKRVYNFDDYAQLARVQEWSDTGGEGDG